MNEEHPTATNAFIIAAIQRLVPELEDAAPDLVRASDNGDDLAEKKPASGLGLDIGFLDPDLLEVFRQLKGLLKQLVDLGVITVLLRWWQSRQEKGDKKQMLAVLGEFESQSAVSAQALRDIAKAVAAFELSRGSRSSAEAVADDVRNAVCEAAIAEIENKHTEP